jgi:hypothetical protein
MRSKAFRSRLVLAGLLLLGSLATCATAQAREKWGPFRGQFVDAETGEPIPGAVVLVVWWKEEGLFHSQRRFYDAREGVSDAQGRFEVPRLSPPFFSFSIQPRQMLFFAPGYKYDSLSLTPPDGEEFVNPTVLKMRRLKTREERIENQRRYPPSIPARKMPLLLEALNRERVALGLEPITRGDVSDP